MELNEYQKLAARTLLDAPGREIPHSELELVRWSLGMAQAATRAMLYRGVLFPNDDRGIMFLWNLTGLVGECGELVEMIKKHVFHQHELDREKVSKEIGDILWYVAALYSKLGLPLGDITRTSTRKLPYTIDENLSDVYGSLTALVLALGLDMDKIMAANIEKLKVRYPGGFTAVDSLARVDVAAGQAGSF